MFVWSLSLYNTIGIKVSFFYAKSRTCSFIVNKKRISISLYVLNIGRGEANNIKISSLILDSKGSTWDVANKRRSTEVNL